LSGGKRPGSLHPIPKTPVPFHTVHIDHLGPFVKKTKAGNTQLFLIIDAFTKFILLYPVKSTKSKLAIKCLQDMIKVFGVPHRIICDHGRSFTSEEFREFCDHIQTKIHFNAVATPRGNGQNSHFHYIYFVLWSLTEHRKNSTTSAILHLTCYILDSFEQNEFFCSTLSEFGNVACGSIP
jgi:transposase InsO family protein